MDTARIESALIPVTNTAWYRASFLADASGQVVLSLGDSKALRNGDEDVQNVARKENVGESLYLTEAGTHMLGVLFENQTDIDVVRARVARVVDDVMAAMNLVS